MSRRPAHQQIDTLKVIQDVSFERFARYGYDGVSIGDIASAAGLSKSALYWHFPGKEALYLDCLKRLHMLFDSYIFNPMRAESDPVRAVLAMFGGFEQLLKDPRVENGVAGYWLTPSGPSTEIFASAQREFEAASMRIIEDCLRRGVEQGRFDFHGDLEEMSRAIISLLEAVVLPLRHMAPQEVQRITGVLARTLFRAYAKTAIPLPSG
jgi:AcrR family transcriptional regulator